MQNIRRHSTDAKDSEKTSDDGDELKQFKIIQELNTLQVSKRQVTKLLHLAERRLDCAIHNRRLAVINLEKTQTANELSRIASAQQLIDLRDKELSRATEILERETNAIAEIEERMQILLKVQDPKLQFNNVILQLQHIKLVL